MLRPYLMSLSSSIRPGPSGVRYRFKQVSQQPRSQGLSSYRLLGRGLSVSQSVNFLHSQLDSQPDHQSASQSVSHPASQSVNHSVNQSVSHPWPASQQSVGRSFIYLFIYSFSGVLHE